MKSVLVLLCSCTIWSCTESDIIEEEIEEQLVFDSDLFEDILDLPSIPFNYSNVSYPDHFYDRDVTSIDNTTAENQVTDMGATLGRVLFYDKKLSANNTIACASCHLQSNGFADPAQFSVGFEGGLTGRNSMGLTNAKFYDNGSFFWDERANTLEEQTLMPIQDHIEMGLTLDELVTKVQAEDYYQYLFNSAFDEDEITSEKISFALAQFVRSMVSYESKYDEGLALSGGNEDANFQNFTDLENLGKDLFMSRRTNCSQCHETVMFSGDEARNNGLDATTTDQGLGAVTGNTNDDGKFKTHSLRNIELTAPYMHDGRLATLEEVVEHYNSGVQNHPNLDNRLRDRRSNQVIRMNLSQNEKAGLVAFLKTLTDENFSVDEKFSDPFIQ